MNRRLPRRPPLILCAAALLLLAGCGSSKIAICPVPAILADTASMTVFRPHTMADMANELYTVSLINAETNCTYAKKSGIVTSSLSLTFRAVRTPASDSPSYTAPFFVVVNDAAKIYVKHLYDLNFSFAPGAATAIIKQSPDDTDIRIENGKLPWDYQLLTGFQLTPEQIAYTKKKARYVP